MAAPRPARQPAGREEPATLACSKQPFKPAPMPAKIDGLRFHVQSFKEIQAGAVLDVHANTLYQMPQRQPTKEGVLDPRLGISNKRAKCHTCGQDLKNCAGHFGVVKLPLPVFHPGYFVLTIRILQVICKVCGRMLLADEQRSGFLKQVLGRRKERGASKGLLREVAAQCKKAKICPHCQAHNGTVKKVVGTFKIVHDALSKQADGRSQFEEDMSGVLAHNAEIRRHMDRALDDLNPARVLRLFRQVPDVDLPLLDVACRPEDLLITYMAVPPVCIRPSVEMDSGAGSNEDDTTTRLLAVCDMSISIRRNLDMGIAAWETIMEQWDFLQVQCALYINSEARLSLEYQKHDKKTHSRGFVQRLKGKQGRFRGNLSGKRVDFSGRTVISPDPNMRIDQVCVPRHQATILTFPEVVNAQNIEEMRSLVLRGPAWPGANQLIRAGGAEVFVLRASKRRDQLAKQLQVGDVVERHCKDGDIVLFNRQPSLHRISIMALHAKVMPWRTLRFNECVCGPFNADFDGDEMNIHLPQTQEARAEAVQLMKTLMNLRTPKSGAVMICANQDFLTTAYLVSGKDRFFTRSQFAQLCGFMGDALDFIELPAPAIVKPVELWTGKQVISMIIRPNSACSIFVNLECKEKVYTSREHFCAKDGYVHIMNSELVSGRIGKGLLGGSKSGLFGVLAARYSSEVAGLCMSRLAKLSARFIGDLGFSIGIADVRPATQLRDEKASMVSSNYSTCNQLIGDFNAGSLELLPGCNKEESLEHRVQGVLNNVRDKAGKLCMRTLHYYNSPLIMASCGSKGSPINIAQMVACVGQQSVGGKRCGNGFQDRTTPHFPRHDKSPAGKGFVANSFYTGLTATEFFFHTMAGREGLVDTAVKTADTGYMSRRLMKSLEDLHLAYDGTVRNSSGAIVQLEYGDDSLDPFEMEGSDGRPLDLKALVREVHMTTTTPGSSLDERSKRIASPAALQRSKRELLDPSSPWTSRCSVSFRDALRAALDDCFKAYVQGREAAGLPSSERGEAFLEYISALPALSDVQMKQFVDVALERYEKKLSEPAAPVGAIAAQSLGEPGTQMTLKTFHFAGVASMNVTLGVPRIKEIINAAKNISTPLMNVALEVDSSEVAARMVKGRLEKTMLKEVVKSVKLHLTNHDSAVMVTLDMDTINSLNLHVNAATVRAALLADRKVRVKEHQVHVIRKDKFALLAAEPEPGKSSAALLALLKTVPEVVVAGIPSVGRAVIQSSKEDGKGTKYSLVVEGTDFRSVLSGVGVDGCKTTTNNISEVEQVLGVEAARTEIMTEIKYIFDQYGMGIDHRHIMMLADLMTCKGVVLGITRFGIVDMKESILHSASFERTTDQLFDAAAKGMADHVTGVSESIILGSAMPVGTGMFDVRQLVDTQVHLQRKNPLFAIS